jgi:hypothetical protein
MRFRIWDNGEMAERIPVWKKRPRSSQSENVILLGVFIAALFGYVLSRLWGIDGMLTVSSYAIQGLMAGLGVYVSLRPQPPDRHRVLIGSFVVLWIVGAGVSVEQQKRSTQAQSELAGQLQHLSAKADIAVDVRALVENPDGTDSVKLILRNDSDIPSGDVVVLFIHRCAGCEFVRIETPYSPCQSHSMPVDDERLCTLIPL